MSRYEPGLKFGKWKLLEQIGEGGNGEVWKVDADDSETRAIKILFRGGVDEPYKRFCLEIEVLKRLGNPEGIVPLLDSYIPTDPKRERPWYVMPLATSYLDVVKNKTPYEIASDFEILASTLHRLHCQGVCHRDIKPANFLILEGRVCLSDFGLVKVPDSEGITPEKRDVGAKFTMAPEMRRFASDADGKPADVYSLAKSLWMALTGESLGFEGQYDPRSTVVGLSNYLSSYYLTPLDKLLAACTDHAPDRRPSAEQFINDFKEWVRVSDDFDDRNGSEWREVSEKIFPLGQPSRAQWEDRRQICDILKVTSSIDGLNHMFYPTGGGMTLQDAELAPEPGMIQLKVSDKMYEICCPERLIFESCAGKPEWNYFRLELKKIKSYLNSDAGEHLQSSEEVTEISPGVYVPLEAWFDHEFNGQPLTDASRRVTRFSGGSFVLFSTSSPYNRDTSTYDARHNSMSSEEFRTYIHRNANAD
ncbi:serine/threonine protein kinase [Pseudomonas shahriarae]|uniref:Serine/threonine protein kinase n=1 Tax=Pseudomonas shahriarae TaxID=2745512 RepID=A0ABT5N891_9PSED|nr:serine/threonine-protein kinase [Pseudomonas shahriarae]MDD0984042.1 serine/threonine protein kinase [Pseudomonas shahriarae]MDD1036232.1 serine/threonine protein kinase [Pseudomonas shahriarae]